MRKIKKNFFTVIIFLGVVLMPLFFSEAAGIVPCGGGGSEPKCELCHLFSGANEIIKLLMGWMTVVATIIIVVAGILYIMSAGNPGMISTAKTALKNTLIGYAIALSAFVLIHFVLKAISNGAPETGPVDNFGTGSWSINC